VIDRNQIDTLMREQNMKFSDRFDPRDAPRLGKLLNVDAIITGSVDAFADEVQNNRVGVGPIGLGKAQAVAEVTVSVRVISTETAIREMPAPSSGGEPSAAGNPPPARLPDSSPLSVGKVEGNKVYITAGVGAGLNVNEYLEVRHPTGSMKDPQGNDIEMDER